MARDGLKSHLSGSLPVSIALHALALAAFFVIPLVANVVVPTVAVTLPEYVQLAALPPPPPEPVVRQPQRASTPAPSDVSTVPTHAPDTITPERVTPPSFTADVLTPDVGAIGSAIGVPTGVLPPTLVHPAEPPRQTGPVRVAELPVAPRKTVDVRPIYPDLARMARIQGTVVLEAVLDPTGRVTQLRVIRSIPMLDQAALDAVRQWRYTPSLYNGRPVSVLMTITMNFTLQ